jgi:hypothetical protein
MIVDPAHRMTYASEVSDSTNSTLAIPPNKESGDLEWFLKRKTFNIKRID